MSFSQTPNKQFFILKNISRNVKVLQILSIYLGNAAKQITVSFPESNNLSNSSLLMQINKIHHIQNFNNQRKFKFKEKKVVVFSSIDFQLKN